MVLPKNAVQFSSFFKYAFSLITTHKSHRFSVFPALWTNLKVEKVAKLPGSFDATFTKSLKGRATKREFYRK
jgi:hypothetical protein